MKRSRLLLAVVLVAIGAAIIWWRAEYPTYSYRYRLTLEIEADEKVYSDARVVEVTWRSGPAIGDGGRFRPTVRGQAPLVDLGHRGAIIAALTNGDYGRASDGTYGAIWIAARAFGNQSLPRELPDLPKLKGTRSLSSDNLPQLVWLPDIADPATARRLPPWQISELVGAGVRLKGVAVEMTSDPVSVDIEKKLPWYPELAARQRARGVSGKPGEFTFNYHKIVGE